MQTEIQTITDDSVALAKAVLESGGVVAIPTETVYGLGANAFDDKAVQMVFAVKGRPNDNPLIAHVHADYDLRAIVAYEPEYAKKLRRAFCPGPLTLVYPSNGAVSRHVSCGLSTVAVRMPSHAGAQKLLRAVDFPVVAPSANVSRHVSPTSAKHVYDDFAGKIPLILDGGECEGGIESTVCDVTGDVPVVLRAGLITREQIAEICGSCLLRDELQKGEKAKSPGMLYKHYSPRCQTKLFLDGEEEKAKAYAKESAQKRVWFLCENDVADGLEKDGYSVLRLGATDKEMAKTLYQKLREAEGIADLLIAIEPKEKTGVMVGVLNRLRKACNSQDVIH